MLTMQLRISAAHLRQIDVLVRKGVYPTRSEAVRDAVRRQFEPLFEKRQMDMVVIPITTPIWLRYRGPPIEADESEKHLRLVEAQYGHYAELVRQEAEFEATLSASQKREMYLLIESMHPGLFGSREQFIVWKLAMFKGYKWRSS